MLLLLLGAAALWGSSKLTWSWTVDSIPAHGAVVREVDGAGTTPALVPLALLALAAVAAVVAMGGWLRRVLGAVLVLLACALGWVAVTAAAGSGLVFLSAAQYEQAHHAMVVGYVGRGLAGLAAVILLTAGVVLVLRGHRLPRLGGSYQTPGAARKAIDPDKELWNALDQGDDPTADAGAADSGSSRDGARLRTSDPDGPAEQH
ncbi:Trp biosynthesis-associated membrane protein [Solihabitans fulvus]|uniref:Trp biosynthesis-associated membrane protein n=1 Tax=Solihabitans fulvus TaxID=1892852 RepID=A0A5B2X6N6_9PSEU|nr:Trp biosynthesis-associated membrane protein [Solihabitans fulvus]